ncbi:GNAT family acetyltransferase [Basidiobolus meristosporus CBS 931.73]|uniref:GNAT family acetyltransferase n=1 Tax=Basidiobolus meristosporus CBS 931.73 TaxID=1314790 RepID=A0A1Y1YB41_9FUNG|nr:GNAT family acetyltransferase [Basidiobolus meristosporus CBS 931.73]|eukprot:ORX95162.1 GNAT family acetyltransferase [Basidiobolus meristosporus CBS 931.73]
MRSFEITNEKVNADVVAHPAASPDAPQIMALLVETAKWLLSKGISQWSDLIQGIDNRHRMAERIEEGSVFKFVKGDVLVGVVIILEQPSPWDIELWGDAGHPESLYIHRLAINREYSGVGRDIMRWVENGIVYSNKTKLRLDCMGSSPALNKFYQSLGYSYQGKSNTGYSLYEKSIK